MIVKEATSLLLRKGIEYSFKGNKGISFDCFAPLEAAGPGDAVMVRDTGDISAKIKKVNLSRPSLAIVPLEYMTYLKNAAAVIAVENPRLVFALIQRELLKRDRPENRYLEMPRWVSIGKDVFIAPFCNIGGDGLSANRMEEGLVHTPHAGRVVIEDNVRIHSFTAVERAVLGETRIGHDTHIDYHCVIGHGVKVGARCRISSGVVLTGGVVLEDDVAIGAGVIINPRIRIGAGAAIGSGAVVTKDVPAGVLVAGVPAREMGTVADSKGVTW